MTRFDDPLFDPRLADWLEEDPSTAPDQALDVVLASLPSIKQRRAVRVPWRNRDMSSTLRLGLAAAVVVAATLGGMYFLSSRTGPSVAAPDSPPPSAAPSETPASPAAERSIRPNWTTFTSPQYGYTVEHPTAFQATPATEEWPAGGIVGNVDPWVDRFLATFGGTNFVGIASQPVPEGTTSEEWIAAYEQQVAERAPCAVPPDAWADTVVDGTPARRADFMCQESPGVEIVWVHGDRGWAISGNPDVVELMLASIEYE
jgi:hypothetical protein